MSKTARIIVLIVAFLVGALPVLAQAPVKPAPLKIVASFTILADLAREVGGDRVVVLSLVGPDSDAHVFQPSPAQARELSDAQILIVNGLGFEGWMDRLKHSAGFKGREIVATTGLAALLRENPLGQMSRAATPRRIDNLDPHAWQDPRHAQLYVENIAAGLAQADPANADYYRKRATDYKQRLIALDAWARTQIATIAPEKRKLITTHDAFRYFARAYEIEFLAANGVTTENEPSAGGIARLLAQMRREGIKALFIENMTSPKMIEQIARDGGGFVGEALYADALSAPGGPADSYEKMFRHNVEALVAGMARN